MTSPVSSPRSPGASPCASAPGFFTPSLLAHLGVKCVPSDFKCVDRATYDFLTTTHQRVMRRSHITKGEKNPSWAGGLSRLPYPWNFNEISKSIIARDGGKCQNPDCSGHDQRLTAHHINYDKQG